VIERTVRATEAVAIIEKKVQVMKVHRKVVDMNITPQTPR
jgi:hypothetical protein